MHVLDGTYLALCWCLCIALYTYCYFWCYNANTVI